MFISSPEIIDIVIRVSLVYLVVLIGLRLNGKREVGQMTPFDFVMLLLIANAVQNAMIGNNTTLWGGVVAATTLLIINTVLTRLVWKNNTFRHLVEGVPTLLVHDGKIIKKNLKKEEITEDVLEEAFREHGVLKISDIKSAVLEIDGSISVVRNDEIPSAPRPRHRIRHLLR